MFGIQIFINMLQILVLKIIADLLSVMFVRTLFNGLLLPKKKKKNPNGNVNNLVSLYVKFGDFATMQ